VAGNNLYHNLVKGRLEPLKEYLGLSHAELQKIVLRTPAVLTLDHNNLVHEKLEPLQAFLGLNAAELKKVVLRTPAVFSCNHDNLVKEKLEPLQALLDLNAAELKKIVLRHPAVLTYNHDSLATKLRLQQKHLGMTTEQFRDVLVADQRAFSVGHIEEKWALLMSDFAEEEGDQKLQALRSLGLRGLGLGLPRLTARLADLKEAFGSAPKASEWFRRVVLDTDAEWVERLPQLPYRLNTSE
jgi:hypothetical protein